MTSSGTRPRAWVAGVAVLATLVLSGCSSTEVACDRLAGVSPGVCLVPEAERRPAPALPDELRPVGDQAPPRLEDLAGDVVVANFWGSWCGPCRIEQPELNEVAEAFADRGVTFVGVALRDSQAGAQGHVREFEIPYDSWFDPASDYPAAFETNVPRSVPATTLVDRRGRIALTINGITDAEELTTLLEVLAAEERP